MRRIRLGDAVRLLAPAAVYTGVSAYAFSDDWRWLGAGMTVGVVTTLIEANRLCDRLARDDDTTELARAAGVMAADPCTMAPPSASMNPAVQDEVDLRRLYAELGPAFAELDRFAGPRAPALERCALSCTCGSAGAVAAPRRGCPIHGGAR